MLVMSAGMVSAFYYGLEKVPLREYIKPAQVNGVWDWSNVRVKTSGELDDTAAFLQRRQINTVFLDISGIASTRNSETTFDAAVSKYILAMRKKGIQVYAAAGHTDWSKPSERWQPEAIMDYVYAYNSRHTDAAFRGIEFDIESYNQDGFAEGPMSEKNRVLVEYMDMVDRLATKHQPHAQDIELGFAIPYWYDNENKNIESIEWNGKTGPILYHLSDRLNQLPKSNLLVMAYRNAALGNDGVIEHSRSEIEYAKYKAPNVKIIIGQETTDVEPAKITYYGQSMPEFSHEAKLIAEEFQTSQSFGGIAINDLDGFTNLADSSDERFPLN
jgi:hypothetical protein